MPWAQFLRSGLCWNSNIPAKHMKTQTNKLAALWRSIGVSPRELRTRNPETLSLDEATVLSVHEWGGAPDGWKAAVLKRKAELQAAAVPAHALYEIRKGGGKVVYGLRLPDGSVKVTCDCDVMGQAGHVSFVVTDAQALELFPMAENGGRVRRLQIQDILPDVLPAVREVFVSGVTPLEWARDVEGAEMDQAQGEGVKENWLKFRAFYDVNADCADAVAEHFGAPAVMVDGVETGEASEEFDGGRLERPDVAARPASSPFLPSVVFVLNAARLVVMWAYVETAEKLQVMRERPGFSKGWEIVVVPVSVVIKANDMLGLVERLAWSAEPLAGMVAEAREIVPVCPVRFGSL